MTTTELNVALAMGPGVVSRVFPRRRLESLPRGLRLLSPEPMEDFTSPRSLELLAKTDILITGWGCPKLDAVALAAAPRLTHVLHAGGTVRHHVGDECWERGIEISTAADANSIPVAEYTVAMILLANKRVLQIARKLHTEKVEIEPDQVFPDMGNFGKRVGIIGASRIGKHVIRLLKSYDVKVFVSDPFLDDAAATELGVERLSLEELVATCDVVSLHAPSLPSTYNLIHQGLVESLKPGATFINTARGELVDQDALLRRIEQGELYAILDVTTPWVLPADSGFYTHPNVLLTPHLAGSLGMELERMAVSTIEEAARISRGEPLRHRLNAKDLAFTA
ncbi:hydroxyacid dehydrogenase [Arthrobacter sp. MYb23]|uniref:hydroxyacid dehydrogenase n=1 Tax=unclassified Arthrobacter TaxID=235627 RepID=UPI000CFD277E|nr:MULTISPECIES: hydroxyacid dehydrogenase [unclassified Arthrobacter]PRB42131.1 hydroxyacid dehydrogenase [Arthrobacter sp. MYb51]PRB95168.1 hydroxyacid dehydrogenase [Arthrobacter sp. MYb23]